MVSRVLGLLGLARRGGKIFLGDSILPLFGKTKNMFVIVANDCSDNTKKKWHDKCSYYHVEYKDFSSKGEIGHALGKDDISVIALTDKNMIAKIKTIFKDGDINGTKQ